jgi:hypothetical protein
MLNAGKVTFGEVVPSVKKCIADLKAEHPDVDFIVGMSHTGVWMGRVLLGFLCIDAPAVFDSAAACPAH